MGREGHLLFIHVEPLLRIIFSSKIRDQIESGESRFRRDETNMRVGLVGECVLMAVKWSRVSGQWSGVSGHLEKRAYSLSPFVDNSVCPRTRGCEFPWERAGLRAGS